MSNESFIQYIKWFLDSVPSNDSWIKSVNGSTLNDSEFNHWNNSWVNSRSDSDHSFCQTIPDSDCCTMLGLLTKLNCLLVLGFALPNDSWIKSVYRWFKIQSAKRFLDSVSRTVSRMIPGSVHQTRFSHPSSTLVESGSDSPLPVPIVSSGSFRKYTIPKKKCSRLLCRIPVWGTWRAGIRNKKIIYILFVCLKGGGVQEFCRLLSSHLFTSLMNLEPGARSVLWAWDRLRNWKCF